MSEIKPVTDVVEEYVAEYEWTDGEGNYYAPKDYERVMLADAIYGLIDADDFKQRHESSLAQARAEERERCKRVIKMVLSDNRLTSTSWTGTFSDGWNAAMDEILQPLMHSIRALSEPDEMTRPDNTEPWYGHKFKRFPGGKWRCECGLELYEPDEMTQAMQEGKVCICADPENCTEPVPGYICKRTGATQ